LFFLIVNPDRRREEQCPFDKRSGGAIQNGRAAGLDCFAFGSQ
jgi:hypothetical protein